MKEILISIFNFFGLAWWIEVVTQNPACRYYFGPFLTARDAEDEKLGYLEDLEAEGSQVSAVFTKRCKPSKITIETQLAGSITPILDW